MSGPGCQGLGPQTQAVTEFRDRLVQGKGCRERKHWEKPLSVPALQAGSGRQASKYRVLGVVGETLGLHKLSHIHSYTQVTGVSKTTCSHTHTHLGYLIS